MLTTEQSIPEKNNDLKKDTLKRSSNFYLGWGTAVTIGTLLSQIVLAIILLNLSLCGANSGWWCGNYLIIVFTAGLTYLLPVIGTIVYWMKTRSWMTSLVVLLVIVAFNSLVIGGDFWNAVLGSTGKWSYNR